MNFFSLILLLPVLVSCAGTKYLVDGHEFKLKCMSEKFFRSSNSKCIDATLAALKSNDYKIKKNNKKGAILTNKRKFDVNAVVQSTSYNKNAGHTSVAAANWKQSNQFLIKVSGNNSKCSVKIAMARLWMAMN